MREKKRGVNIKEVKVGVTDVFKLRPHDIHLEEGFNVRRDSEELQKHIEWLSHSIEDKGIETPLKIYKNDGLYYLVSGHCRMAAVEMAVARGATGDNVEKIPCMVTRDNELARTISLHTDNTGLRLDMLGKSDLVARMGMMGVARKQIAENLGFTVTHVEDLFILFEADKELKQMIDQGQISATVVVDTVRTKGVDALEIIKCAAQVAGEAGSKKVTSKHIDQKPKGIDYRKHGKEAFGLLKAIVDAQSDGDMQAALADASMFIENLEEDK